MYTLCVIDMQDWFQVKPNTRVSDNSAREIKNAIQDGASILFVEYKDCGPTIEQLTRITQEQHYHNAYRVEKRGDNGSIPIIDKIRANNLHEGHIKVVGVNTDCCVYRTVCGLKFDLPNTLIEVVGDACDSYWDPGAHQRGLKSIQDLGCQVSNNV
jgi:Isochorismatase family